MAVVELIYDVKPYSYITSNPTKILSNGEPIYLSDGRYGFGDGITTLSSLPLYGGSGYAFTGLTSQYTRGDGTYATFPTNVSSFTNDSGYITSSALSPYLTIANAALTYQPIGSYLTGLTVGSTAIGSGTNTRILYNNAGVLGEYAVTGTGTTAVLSNSPTISTSLTVTTASTTNVIRDLVGTPTSSAIYLNQTTPSATNYVLMDDGSSVYLNGRTSNSIYISLAATNIVRFDSNFQIHTPTSVTSGSTTTFSWTKPNNTGQTASTNIPGFLFTTGSRQWATGAITTQEEVRITSPTYSFASASTITNAYTLFVNSPIAGTNATITNNYAAGFNGNVILNTSSARLWLGDMTVSSTNYALGYTATNEISLNSGAIGRIRSAGTIVATWSSTDFTVNCSGGLVIANNSTDAKIAMTRTSGNTHSLQLNTSGYFMYNNTAAAVRYGVTNAGNFYVGAPSSLATTATDGYLYLPSCAGVPTGVPTAITGKVPIVVDSTNNKAYIYSGGAWVALN